MKGYLPRFSAYRGHRTPTRAGVLSPRLLKNSVNQIIAISALIIYAPIAPAFTTFCRYLRPFKNKPIHV